MLPAILRDMLNSKKFLAALAGVVVGLAARAGLQLETESLIAVLTPIVAYVLGQGLADAGKEASRLEKGRSK